MDATTRAGALADVRALSAEFARLDWRLYMRTIRAMARHDAWPRLGELSAPALVEGATHYLPLEFPAVLDERVRRFEAERLGTEGAAV